MSDRGGRRSQLLAAVVLSACIGLLGGALAAWGIYARFGPVERVITQVPSSGPAGGGGLSVAAVAQQAEASIVEIGTRPLGASALLSGAAGVVDGFVVSADGLVVTTVHAIHGATALTIATNDGHAFPATIVRADQAHGVVVLRAQNAQGLTPLTFAGDEPRPGDVAIAVAHAPFTAFTLSTGVVGSTGRTLTLSDGEPVLSDVTSVDATPDPREDGAPLLSGGGDVTGVVVDAGGAAPGVVALSGRAAAALVAAVTGSGGSVATPTLGADALVLDPATAAVAGVPAGALVRSVDPGGPSALAGLAAGDVVTAVDGVAIDAGHPFDAVALGLTPDQQVSVAYWRAGASSSVIISVTAAGPGTG